MILRSNYSDLYTSAALPALEELFRQEFNQAPMVRDMIFRKRSTDRDIWQYSEIHDLPLFQEISEGDDYTFNRPKQGSNKTLSIKKFGLGFSISEEAVDDGKFDMISIALKKLARSARESQAISAMNIFNNGFSSQTTADGQALFSDSHTLPSGGTFDNKGTGAALSSTALETALQNFETNFVGDSGIIYDIRPKYLLVAPANKRLAKELLGSELKPETVTNSTTGVTNINNMNSYREEGVSPLSSVHLTNSAAWFLVAEAENTGLTIVTRKPLETKGAGPDLGFVSDSMFYKARYREIVDVVDAYGVWGNAGS